MSDSPAACQSLAEVRGLAHVIIIVYYLIKVADNLHLSNIEKSCKDTFYYLFLIRAFRSCSMIHLEDVLYQSWESLLKKSVLISYKVNMEKLKVESVWFPNSKLFLDNVACRSYFNFQMSSCFVSEFSVVLEQFNKNCPISGLKNLPGHQICKSMYCTGLVNYMCQLIKCKWNKIDWNAHSFAS